MSRPLVGAPELDPDGLTGAILAIEGIRDAAVLLNGPTGCKFYHAAISEGQLPRESSYDPLQYQDEFYFGQPRVPATYLDRDDYVFGASEKLERILPVVAAKGHRLIGVINSPGAALIGDDLARFIEAAELDVPCVAIESTGYSGVVQEGFQDALIRTLEVLDPPARSPLPHRVNLIGMSIEQLHWEGSRAELCRLLELCGIEVGAVLSAGATVAELEWARSASCNVMVHEEYGDALAGWCEQNWSLDTLRPLAGAPIGFDATETWLRGICERLAVDPAPGLLPVDQARMRAVSHIKRFNSLTGLPKGATFSVHAPASTALTLTSWLHDYLGMAPVTVRSSTPQSPLNEALATTLLGCRAADPAVSGPLQPADCVFADGARLAALQLQEPALGGIELALPSRGRIDVVPKAVLGAGGALHLLEWVLTALDC